MVAKDLKIDDYVARVFLYGVSGAKVHNFNIPRLMLSRIRPSIILLDLGTNDLVGGAKVSVLVNGLRDMAIDLRDDLQAVVVIMSVLYRAEGLGGFTPESFKHEVEKFNLELSLRVKDDANVVFHKHKGFWEQEMGGKKVELPIESWSRDGIHPNSSQGRLRYKKSIRAAMVKALKVLSGH